jgi:hypothetical protein
MASASPGRPSRRVPKMDCAQFVLVGSLQPVVAHRDQGDLIGRPREKSADGRLCRDQRGRVGPYGLVCRLDDALCTSAGPLNDRFVPKIDRRDLERRVAEFEAIWCPAAALAMQIWPIPASRRARAFSTVRTITIFDAPFAKATAAVVKARKTLMTATVRSPASLPSGDCGSKFPSPDPLVPPLTVWCHVPRLRSASDGSEIGVILTVRNHLDRRRHH